jgi:hypothetical protein
MFVSSGVVLWILKDGVGKDLDAIVRWTVVRID